MQKKVIILVELESGWPWLNQIMIWIVTGHSSCSVVLVQGSTQNLSSYTLCFIDKISNPHCKLWNQLCFLPVLLFHQHPLPSPCLPSSGAEVSICKACSHKIQNSLGRRESCICMFKDGGSHNQINVVESLLIHMEEPALQLNGGAAVLQALASVR